MRTKLTNMKIKLILCQCCKSVKSFYKHYSDKEKEEKWKQNYNASSCFHKAFSAQQQSKWENDFPQNM